MAMPSYDPSPRALAHLAQKLRAFAREIGFSGLRISAVTLPEGEAGLAAWLAAGHHGDMDYMARHAELRARPDALVPGTLAVITVRMDYLPANAAPAEDVLRMPEHGYIARYALGRDYHKVLRQRLERLAKRLEAMAGPLKYRVFTDSAPVMEVALARQAGLGWRGKNTLLLARDGGSFFFLGEIFTDLPLPPDEPVSAHCGNCTACLTSCPTGAFVAPYRLDARRCISYLTIEHKGAIPEALRPLMGNRIYGCDDCQLVCPWNRFARASTEPDFAVRHGLDAPRLVALFAWSPEEFAHRMAGSAIRRIGHERWLRNIAVALGNAPTSRDVLAALKSRADDPSPLVREHVRWALRRHGVVQNGK